MTADESRFVDFDKRPKKDIYALPRGARVRLTDGSVREIVNNPLDGVWMIVRAIDDGNVDDTNVEEEMILITDIEGTVR